MPNPTIKEIPEEQGEETDARNSTGKNIKSQQKLDANRHNAKKSTGPRTVEGKSHSKYNALKHGILAKEAVITVGPGRESRVQFNELLRQLNADLQPIGFLEQVIVEDIAVNIWRLRRTLRAEVGEIRKYLDTVGSLEVIRSYKQSTSGPPYQANAAREMMDDMMDPMWVEWLLDSLHTLKQVIEREGHDREKISDTLVKDSEYLALLRFQKAEVALETEAEYKGIELRDLNDEERKKLLLEKVDGQIRAANTLESTAQENRLLELQALKQRLVLPEASASDKILRYEAAIRRNLHKDLQQLERLQRLRSGQALPPPLSVNISGID